MGKLRNISFISIFLFLVVFVCSLVKLTNWTLEKMFRKNFDSTFHLLTLIVNNSLLQEKELEKEEIEFLRKKSVDISKDTRNLNNVLLSHGIQGIWLFKNAKLQKTINNSEFEDEVLSFYEQNLIGKEAHTLIVIDNKPYLVANFLSDSSDILFLSGIRGMFGMRINQLLDSLVTSSALVYFSILDENETPVVFSSLYDNFLPLKGTGYHTIYAPGGKIFQIEEDFAGKNFIAGFTMSSFEKIQRTNNLLLIFIIIIFAVLEGLILFNFIKFDKFRVKKEREVNVLKEISALSTGFAHEFRNSLHTLSLLGKLINEEERNILYKEIERIQSVMDSFKLLGKTEIDKKEVEITELIDESISFLQNMITENKIKIEKKINEKIVFYGNSLLLVTVFSNFIKNSIEANARNILIEADKKGNDVQIYFIDDGKGVDNMLTGQIFEPFFSNKGQSGLGLYLASKIIEAHKGKIELHRNGNTIFKVTLKIK